ncbi:ATP-dependent helicase [Blattabacterium cuenoti]|uniref:ATP-dependent helicase n=1 Tax=Blattabacterium cuenoti TaxID=1653831 RepID=UPI00163BD56E|nr:UvrD-helicase domain-containing protein [Blattabacterium cuenoti]
MSLNSSQKKIIETINGPILVLAGAGSGKTRVITYRIVHMVKNIGINPSNILALTFTKKAAKEMKHRIYNMMDKNHIDDMTLGTFHSIFSLILRKESHLLGYKPNYTIYDQKDSENVIKRILEDVDLDIDRSLTPKKIRKIISEYKNNLYIKNNRDSKYISKIYKFYIQRCLQSGALDFDDILLHTNHLFSNFPNILEKYQNKFKYILIDEYQDTNLSQKTIIKSLSSKYKNLFVVGDDAQSIYAFRGANISNILNFHIDYKNAKVFRLEQNYRSTLHIVQASNNIISFNKNQILKKIWTNNEKGEKVRIYCANSEKEEAQYIASSISSIRKKTKYSYEDFAILYRANVQSNIIEYALKEKNIPYKIYGSISFEKRKEIRDLLAYLKVIINSNDEESLLRILKKRNKNIIRDILDLSKKIKVTIYNIIKDIENYQHLLSINKKTKNKLKKLILVIENIRLKITEKDAFSIAKDVVFLLLEENSKNYRYEHFLSILNNISYYVNEQKKLRNDGDISLSGFLQYFYLEIDENINHDKNDKNKVSLMTIHLSKGLEFPIVFIAGLEENLFPSKSSLNNQFKIEEERRLFYVALTRAQKKAVLTYAKSRFLWGERKKNIPSRFINELDHNFIYVENKNSTYLEKNKLSISTVVNNNSYEERDFKIGVKVFHKNFGSGLIIDLENENKVAIIRFIKSGKKRILLKFALEKLFIYS